jgi:phage baseplate assembly protein W
MDGSSTPRAFLGIGWRFPLQVAPDGRIATSRQERKIEESILLILSTAPGERLMMPEYGCSIHELVFEPNEPRTVALVSHYVRESLARHEPRIDLLDVNAQTSADAPNLLMIRVHYRVRSTNTVGNLVYPFYIHEGR